MSSNPWLEAANAIDKLRDQITRSNIADLANDITAVQSQLAEVCAIVSADDATLAATLTGITDLLGMIASNARALVGHPDQVLTAASHHPAPEVLQ